MGVLICLLQLRATTPLICGIWLLVFLINRVLKECVVPLCGTQIYWIVGRTDSLVHKRPKSQAEPMSGIETIGIIASASQLAAYGIRIVSCLSQLYKEVSVMPHKIRDHIKQIEKLVETTILIQEHDSLRSPAIHSHLHTTLNEAVSLYNILTKIASKFAERSFWAFWTFLKSVGEKDILNRLSNLEREKSALRLCISLIHTDLLLNIQSSLNLATIGRMAATNGNLGLSRSVSSPGSRIGSENTSVSYNHWDTLQVSSECFLEHVRTW